MFKMLIAVLALVPAMAWGAERNDVPSCYEQSKLTEFKAPSSGRLLTVIIDQTTPLTKELQQTAWGHIKRFMQPGDKLRLYSFSAYLNGHYTRLEFSGGLEKPLEESVIGDVPMMSARKLSNCLASQPPLLWSSFGKAFAATMGTSSTDIPRSEILFSLREISADLRNAKDVNEQVIFLMSDMLEYSDFGSFYAANRMRDLNPAVELAKVEKQSLFADFAGARVYVHGAAFVPQDTKNGYRSGKLIQNLQSFWTGYFARSHAELKGFGTPELTAVVE
jgi:hypothetical protein